MIQSVLSQQWDEIIIYNTQIIAAIMMITNCELKDIIQTGYLKDKQAQHMLEQSTEEFKRTSNDLILFKELVYILKHQQKDIIWMYHNKSLRGHWGAHKMIEAIFWSYYFSHMRKKVQGHVNKCNLCHKIKPVRRKSYGEMRTVSTPSWPWASISMNFIVKLSPSKKPLTEVTYNSILIIVDWLTKEVRFLPYKKVSDAEELTYTFLRNVTALQRLSDEIILNRDKLFTLRFWTVLTRQLGLSHKLSTVYHSQTDEQTEWMNQVIEQYLREYVNYQQTNWVPLLSLAQLTYNTSINVTTEQTPFFTNHEYNTSLFLESREVTVLTEQIRITADKMYKLHKELKTDIKFLSHHSAFYHNQHYAGALMLKKRDKVYLLQKNIEMTRPSNKLDHVKIRPFKIIRNIKGTSFKLKLPEGMWQKHSVFHIFLLKSAPAEVPALVQVSDNYLMKQEEWYKVEQILEHKDINCKWHYLVKWKEYPASEDTWELIMNLDDCKKTIKKHLWDTHSQARTTDQSQQELQPD